MDVTFVTVSDQESKPIKYYLDMTKWDPTNLGMKINFDDPLMVGKGNDQVMTALKDPSLFVSKASGTAISKEKATSVKVAKTQCAKGVKEEDLNKQSTTAKNGVFAMIVIQLVAQILLKGTMKDLWGMFFTLQIICYLATYNVVIPANS